MPDRPPSIFENYDDELVDLDTAAHVLGLPTALLHELVADRRIIHYLIHNAPCFVVSDLTSWRQRHPITAANRSKPPSVFTEPLDQPALDQDAHDGYRVIDLPTPTTPSSTTARPLPAAS